MNGAQIISMSITVLAIFAGSLYNNVRISDMAARFGDVNRSTDDVGAVLRAEMNLQFERTNNKIDALLKLMVDIDQRVTTLEARKA
jgi:hypothetical protein